MMKVTPIMTGIICSSRRMMYLPTPTPSRKRFGRASRTKHSGGPPKLLRRADALSDVSRACRSLHLDRREIEHTEGVHLDVGDLVRPGRRRYVVPKRSVREILGEQGLGLLIQGIGLIRRRRRGRLGQQSLELRVLIPAPVGSRRKGFLGVERRQVVLDRGVVRLPAAAEDALQLVRIDLLVVRGEVPPPHPHPPPPPA